MTCLNKDARDSREAEVYTEQEGYKNQKKVECQDMNKSTEELSEVLSVEAQTTPRN